MTGEVGSGISDPACRAAFVAGVEKLGGGDSAMAQVANAFGQPQCVLVPDSTVPAATGTPGQHRSLIPDGKLASANRLGGDYSGFDTAHHAGGHLEYDVTKDGVDLSKPLAWDDLDAVPLRLRQ
ncbi:putative carbohydrate-binding protein with CBM5 and CBM33 domain [Streptacidiphilus sp. MAP12-20]|uniref:lytic polysaccharide monooxygenase n=1 Tax=Streptacidiphilus sp. MAP12-20 TaxID=3156299 RepID=UPI0035113D19